MEALIREILLEEKFHQLKKDITFNFDIHRDTYGHTNQRKWRHGGGENRITDYDIINLLKGAQEDIIRNIIKGKIRNNRRFIVSQSGGDHLNVVINPEEIDYDDWNLTTITVINTPEFRKTPHQLQIFV